MRYKIWLRHDGIELEEDPEGKYFSEPSIQEAVKYTTKQLNGWIEEYDKRLKAAKKQLKMLEEWYEKEILKHEVK